MLGHRMTEVNVNIPTKGDAVLKLKNVQLEDSSAPINLNIHKNEVVAITGLLGSGKSLLASILFGIATPKSGLVFLDGKNLKARIVTSM